MGNPRDKANASFRLFVNSELGRKVHPFKITKKENKVTTGVQTNFSIIRLPSFEPIAKKMREESVRIAFQDSEISSFKSLFRSLAILTTQHNKFEWLSLAPISIVPIIILSSFEFVLRTLGALALLPVYALNESKEVPTSLKVIGSVLLSPLWFLGETVSYTADILTYTRGFIDSAVRLLNPLWWVFCKLPESLGVEGAEYLPSVRNVVKTFLSSTLNLIPAAVVATAAVLTAGISIPLLASLGLPSLGTIIASSFTSSITAAVASVTAMVYAGGAIASACKLMAYGVKNMFNAFFDKKADPLSKVNTKTAPISSEPRSQATLLSRFIAKITPGSKKSATNGLANNTWKERRGSGSLTAPSNLNTPIHVDHPNTNTNRKNTLPLVDDTSTDTNTFTNRKSTFTPR